MRVNWSSKATVCRVPWDEELQRRYLAVCSTLEGGAEVKYFSARQLRDLGSPAAKKGSHFATHALVPNRNTSVENK